MASRPPVKRKPPNKPEIELIKRYIDNELSAEDEQLFEARLLADDRFFVRVAPYVRTWLMGDGQSPTARRLRQKRPDLYKRVWEIHSLAATDLADEADLALITDYLAGFMTEEEMVAFDERLASDDAFFDRMAPFIKIWFYRSPPSIIEVGLKKSQRLAKKTETAPKLAP